MHEKTSCSQKSALNELRTELAQAAIAQQEHSKRHGLLSQITKAKLCTFARSCHSEFRLCALNAVSGGYLRQMLGCSRLDMLCTVYESARFNSDSFPPEGSKVHHSAGNGALVQSNGLLQSPPSYCSAGQLNYCW